MHRWQDVVAERTRGQRLRGHLEGSLKGISVADSVEPRQVRRIVFVSLLLNQKALNSQSIEIGRKGE